MPCILLTCIYVQPCVCKYIEASEQGCAVVRVCYLYSNVKLDWPFCTLLLYASCRESLWGNSFGSGSMHCLSCSCSQCSRVSLPSPRGSRSRASMERTRGQRGAHLCSHPRYRHCLKFSGSFLMAAHLAFFNHSTQLGGQALVAECVPTHHGHPGPLHAVCD